MKFASSFALKAVLQFSAEDVRPPHGYPPQLIVKGIADRYRFANAPALQSQQLVTQIAPGGVLLPMAPFVFQQGVFEHGGTTVQITQLEISVSPSIIAVTTYSAETADAFLDDLILYLEEAFHYQNILEHSNRAYGSNVIIEFDESVEANISALSEIGKLLSKTFSERLGAKLQVELERMTFSPDPLNIPLGLVPFFSNFVIERRAQHPYAENRFFSSAPLRTDEHLAALEEIERIFLRHAYKTSRKKG